MIDEGFSPDRDSLIEISKPIFYGYVFLAGITINMSPQYSGTMLGIATMAGIGFVSAGLSGSVDEKWQRLIDIMSVVTVLGALLAGSYIAVSLSLL